MDERQPKDFQIEPQSNNSVTLWVRGVPIQVYVDHGDLIVMVPDEMEVVDDESSIRLKRKSR